MNPRKRSRAESPFQTNLTTTDCEFKWTISNFQKLLGSKTSIKSRDLSLKNIEFSGWFVGLKLHNEEDDTSPSSSSETYVSIRVNCAKNNESIVKLNFDLSVVNDQDENCRTSSLPNLSSENLQFFGFDKFITWDELIHPDSKFLQNDTVKFFLKISLTKFENEAKNSFPAESNDESPVIGKTSYPSIMYKSADFSDLTIVFDDVSLLVHKAIIAGKSEVLLKKIKKLKDNELRLPMSFPAGQELISFIYTGHCPKLLENIDELYQASIRLKMYDLGNLIETTVTDTITIENASNRLVWAEENKAKNLKLECINFIKRNIRQMIARDDFQIITQNLNLMRELFFATVENYSNDVVET